MFYWLSLSVCISLLFYYYYYLLFFFLYFSFLFFSFLLFFSSLLPCSLGSSYGSVTMMVAQGSFFGRISDKYVFFIYFILFFFIFHFSFFIFHFSFFIFHFSFFISTPLPYSTPPPQVHWRHLPHPLKHPRKPRWHLACFFCSSSC